MLSLARGNSLRTTRNLSVFLSFYEVKKRAISILLPWILSGPSTSASVSYAESSGSDTMPRILTVHFATTYLQVNNLRKDTFGKKYSDYRSRRGPCKIN